MGGEDPGAAFSAVIQLGTLAAVLIYFARDIARLTKAALLSLWRKEARRTAEARLAWAIAAGNIPIVVAGLAARRWIETEARSLVLIAMMLIGVGLLLALAERVAKRNGEMSGLTLRQVFVIGLFQAFALIPGASRSGVTILGGLLLGLKRDQAARFSFLLGVPAVLGSGVFQLQAAAGSHARPGLGRGRDGSVGGADQRIRGDRISAGLSSHPQHAAIRGLPGGGWRAAAGAGLEGGDRLESPYGEILLFLPQAFAH